MSDFTPDWWDEPYPYPDWLDEPYPLDHTITWREHFANKPEAFHWTHSALCECNRTPNER